MLGVFGRIKIMDFLSPTSIKLFKEDREQFYLRYLAEQRLPKEPQTIQMAIGSAFDAFVKSYLHSCYHDPDPVYENLFEKQVEPQNRDIARRLGESIFEEYRRAGCLADLIIEMDKAVGPPRFEFEIKADVIGPSGQAVPLLGKPDVFFISSKGARVVYDWKVNGVVTADGEIPIYTTSPMKGYISLKEEINGAYYNKMHKDCKLKNWRGILINEALFLEDCNEDWAQQLVIYSWLLGEEVGSEEVVFGIDQVTGGRLRFATHRLLVRPDFQYNLLVEIEEIWELVQSGKVIDDPELLEKSLRIEDKKFLAVTK